ncbi:hypothetical protein Tco_1008498 [Tanacetum coccineum]
MAKQHQNEVNEIRAERLARTANPLALVAQQQPVYHPQNHHTHYTHNSSTRSQQAATRNRGKSIVNSPPPTYDQEPKMVAEDDSLSKDKEIDKLMALISLSFKKIYKPTNNNLRTSSNTSRAHQDNTPRINRGTRYDNQMAVNVAGDRENVVQNDNDNYNVFANDIEHPEQPESVNDIYLDEQGDINIPTNSLDMSNNRGQADQDEDDDLAREHLKKFQAELDMYHDVNYVSKMKIDCAKAKGDLMPCREDITEEKISASTCVFWVHFLTTWGKRYYKDDSCWSVDLKLKTTEDIISIGGFVEVLVLNPYVLIKKILECYYANHMNAILGVYTTLDEFTDLQCDYVDQVVKCERLEKELSKSNTTSKSFEALQQHAIDLELALQQCQEQIKMTKISKKSVKSIYERM